MSDEEKCREIHIKLCLAHDTLYRALEGFEEFGCREEILEIQSAALKIGRIAIAFGADLTDTPERRVVIAPAVKQWPQGETLLSAIAKKSKRKGISAAGRKAISDAQKARWAAKKKATAKKK